MTEVFLVKSGRQNYSGDWQWENLAIFDNHDSAVTYSRMVENQIDPQDFDEIETVEIEVFSLRSFV